MIERNSLTENTYKVGISSNMLKILAIVTMFLDHYAYFFLAAGSPEYIFCRTLGRITGPIMFYLLAVGYRHTRNINKYMLRLGIFAIISYIPYFYMTQKTLPTIESFASFNVLYTLFLGLIALRARHEIKNPLIKWGIIALVLFLSVPSDWYYLGIIIILLFDYFYGDFNKQAFTYILIVLLNIMPVLSPAIRSLYTGQEFSADTFFANIYKLGMFIPIILLKFYNGKQGRKNALSKWGFYIFYPAHLAVLGIAYFLINK